jgi:hypothetical protein
MQFFLQDDLISPTIQTPIGNNPQNIFVSSILNQSTPTMEFVLFRFQMFLLAWCIFYSFIAISQFLDYRVIRPTGNVDDDIQANKGLKYALLIWWSWLPVWFFYVITDLNRSSFVGFFLGLFTISLGFIKMYLDLKWILEISASLTWSNQFANYLRTVLRLK